MITDNKSTPTAEMPREGWERNTLERLALAAINEQRRARRWGIFFKLFFAVYFVFLLVALFADFSGPSMSSRYTALIELNGEIASDGPASADNIITGLRHAFETKGTAAVIIRANSPGGSPVQAAYIYDEIKRLREKYPETPLYGVVTDMCASGCYYALAAADMIYADRSSIVGSIGVLMNGFGFVDTMKKFGVERRLLTAGENKGFLDPFSPLTPKDRKRAKALLGNVHQQFIDRVRDGRGDNLNETKDMYSGMFWTGEEALKLGLIDEFGSAGQVARDIVGAEVIIDFSVREGVVDRFTRRLGSAIAQQLPGFGLIGHTPQIR